ncbi:MAG: hypothetical protein AABM43_02895 [Actinomycetota bacterium]
MGDDLLRGYFGHDLVRGGDGNDELHGGPGNDVEYAGPGVDTVFGGRGNDVISALAQVDVSQPGVDTVHARRGNDMVLVRDGEADQVFCGSGFDTVIADQQDVVARSCERVLRGDPQPGEDNQEVSS